VNEHEFGFQLTPGAAEGAEQLGTLRLGDLAATVVKTVRGSRGGLSRAGRLAVEAGRIAAGRSSIEPPRRDWRFADATWRGNPGYRRVMQLYLAWCGEMDDLVASADLGWRDAERAKFVMSILTSAAAPTNTLAGNPAALKRTFETGGANLLRGTRQRIDDLRHNGAMPAQIKRGHFTVGGDLAATPGAVVHRDEVCELIQYAPTTALVQRRPVLMVPPQINKYYFMDLAPGRSFVEYAVSRGIPFFTLSWRNAGPEQGTWDFDTYAVAVLRALDVVCEITGSDDVHALGLCAGGILTAATASHLAAMGDDRLRTASFGVTLLDFETPAAIGLFDSRPVVSTARKQSARKRVLDGPSLGSVFSWLRPNDLVWNYWVNNYLMGDEPPTFDILAWNNDATNLPAALHSQFLDIFTDNVLAAGETEVLGTPVDLGRIELDTYVTGALTDHLTPWKGCYRTTQLVGGDSTFILSNAGHIASLVNPPGNPKAHYFAGPQPGEDPDRWRASAEERRGTWWEDWAGWVIDRTDGERKAPARLGSRRHKPIGPAPGSYVLD
jgi:polyhydroxyalkanoate synthase subunit PhaC